ncbi:hypothetical protein EBT16_03100 [bacterium]|nr:hypothetical protein [bacterium]
MKNLSALLFIFLVLVVSGEAFAESQGSDYKGISDPFGDPTAYEFSEDEKLDKEFFHLGRFLMLGIDFGLGSYTGGLGENLEAAFYSGGHLVYFFDKSLAFEGRGGYVKHKIADGSSAQETILIPLNFGFRFYPDVKNAPKPIAVANPYLALGGGLYIQKVSSGALAEDVSTNNMGGYFGGGLQFQVYRRHIYMGADLRYHLVYFNAEGTGVNPDATSGNYFTSVFSFTYNF